MKFVLLKIRSRNGIYLFQLMNEHKIRHTRTYK